MEEGSFKKCNGAQIQVEVPLMRYLLHLGWRDSECYVGYETKLK
jgi:hypothetical protein